MSSADRLARCLGQDRQEVDRAGAVNDLLTHILQSVAVDVDLYEPGRVRVSRPQRAALALVPLCLPGRAFRGSTSFPAPGARRIASTATPTRNALSRSGPPLAHGEGQRNGEEIFCSTRVDPATPAVVRIRPWTSTRASPCPAHTCTKWNWPAARRDPPHHAHGLESAAGRRRVAHVPSFRRRAVAASRPATSPRWPVGAARGRLAGHRQSAHWAGHDRAAAQRDRFGTDGGHVPPQGGSSTPCTKRSPPIASGVTPVAGGAHYAACPFNFFLRHVLGVEPV